ncbi:MAG: FtsQ-type POTRA domain-containing protein [Gammaproteobacteria bacterium]|nr:FtsQ-type POTRA domain-containing protein [Gammaproteobacteria bacterium]
MRIILIFLALLILLLGTYNYPVFFGSNPVKHIYKEGTFEHSNESRVDTILKTYISHEIYEINLRELKNLLEEDPWIKNAQIILSPPDMINARISEFEPLFLWNNSLYIDDTGSSIPVNNYYVKDILKISSTKDDQISMYNLYLSIQEIFTSIDITIIELSKDDEMLIILTSGYRFFVRYSDYDLKLKEFTSVYDQFLLTQKSRKIRKNIDLRYPTGFAVQ